MSKSVNKYKRKDIAEAVWEMNVGTHMPQQIAALGDNGYQQNSCKICAEFCITVELLFFSLEHKYRQCKSCDTEFRAEQHKLLLNVKIAFSCKEHIKI